MLSTPMLVRCTVTVIVAGVVVAGCRETHEPLPDVRITMVGTLTWENGEPVVPGTPRCHSVDIWTIQGGWGTGHDEREIHTTTDASGGYTLSWMEYSCVSVSRPNYLVRISPGRGAHGTCTGHPYVCQTEPQRRDCVFNYPDTQAVND
jgi:hypothetical protein